MCNKQRQPEILRGPPQPVVDRMTIGLVGQWRDRDEGSDEAQFLAPLELLAALVDIVDVKHADPLQTLGIGLAEIGDPVVVDSADLSQELAVRDAVPEEALAGLQTRSPDAVLFILADHRVGIVAALADILPDTEEIDLRGVLEALAGLHYRPERPDLHAVEHPGVVFPAGRGLAALHLGRPVAEPRLDTPRIHVRRLDNVGIRRDQLVLRHHRPPPLSPSSGTPRSAGQTLLLLEMSSQAALAADRMQFRSGC